MALIRSKNLLAAALVAALPAAASAQSADVTAVAEPESGFQVGAARVNPTLELELRSDSAAAYDAEAREAVSDVIFHIRPGLRLKAPSDSVELSFKGNYDYNAYLATEEGQPDMDRSGWDIDANALFNRKGNVRFEIGDRFVRTDRNSNLTLGIDNISNRNDLAARLQFLGGDSWTIAPSYVLTTETFDSIYDDAFSKAAYERYDYLAHTARLDARLKVFGRSALMLDGSYTARDYTADDVTIAGIVVPSAHDTSALNLTLGLTGMLSSKLGYTVKGGFASQSIDQPAGETELDTFGGFIGGAELRWFANALSEVRVGYARTFQADPTTVYYTDDRIFLDAGTKLGTKLSLKAGVAYDMIGYGELRGEEQQKDLSDTVVALHIGPEYQFNRWFSAGIRYALTSRDTDRDTTTSAFYEYDRHELGARVSLMY